MNKKKSIKDKNEFLNYMLDLLERWANFPTNPYLGVMLYVNTMQPLRLSLMARFYFKTDTTNRKDYESYNSNPLTYRKQGKTISLSDLEVPTEVIEDQDRLLQWANTAYKIAKNVRKKNNKSKDK